MNINMSPEDKEALLNHFKTSVCRNIEIKQTLKDLLEKGYTKDQIRDVLDELDY